MYKSLFSCVPQTLCPRLPCRSHQQKVALRSPWKPKFGWRRQPVAWQRRLETLIIFGSLCSEQNEALWSPCTNQRNTSSTGGGGSTTLCCRFLMFCSLRFAGLFDSSKPSAGRELLSLGDVTTGSRQSFGRCLRFWTNYLPPCQIPGHGLYQESKKATNAQKTCVCLCEAVSENGFGFGVYQQGEGVSVDNDAALRQELAGDTQEELCIHKFFGTGGLGCVPISCLT